MIVLFRTAVLRPSRLKLDWREHIQNSSESLGIKLRGAFNKLDLFIYSLSTRDSDINMVFTLFQNDGVVDDV